VGELQTRYKKVAWSYGAEPRPYWILYKNTDVCKFVSLNSGIDSNKYGNPQINVLSRNRNPPKFSPRMGKNITGYYSNDLVEGYDSSSSPYKQPPTSPIGSISPISISIPFTPPKAPTTPTMIPNVDFQSTSPINIKLTELHPQPQTSVIEKLLFEERLFEALVEKRKKERELKKLDEEISSLLSQLSISPTEREREIPVVIGGPYDKDVEIVTVIRPARPREIKKEKDT